MHVYHAGCIGETTVCPQCRNSPLELWDPDAPTGRCLLDSCRGHCRPKSVCDDCLEAFQVRVCSTVTSLFEKHKRPGTFAEVVHAFFAQAAMLPEWFRFPQIPLDTIWRLSGRIADGRDVHPILAEMYETTISVLQNIDSVVTIISANRAVAWPTPQYYADLLRKLPLGLYTAAQIAESGAKLKRTPQRLQLFSQWCRTQAASGLSAHTIVDGCTKSIGYRLCTRHAVFSEKTLRRALSKASIRGIPVAELWGEHADVPVWLDDLRRANKIVEIEDRVYASNAVGHATESAVFVRLAPTLFQVQRR